MKPSKKSKLTIIVLVIVLIAVAAHRLHFKKYFENKDQASAVHPHQLLRSVVPTITPVPLKLVMPHANNLRAKFIAFLLPVIRDENAKIFTERKRIDHYYVHWLAKIPLSKADINWLSNVAAHYDVKKPDFNSASTWHTLLRRVDIIPVSLALAQAINESAWGRSRFARLGNNYYGRWCYVQGCGIIPKERPRNAKYEVKRYPNAFASVKDYLHNLNSARFYHQLREERLHMRQLHKPLNGYILAESLNHYSQRGQGYAPMLQSIIRNFDLQQYDA